MNQCVFDKLVRSYISRCSDSPNLRRNWRRRYRIHQKARNQCICENAISLRRTKPCILSQLEKESKHKFLDSGCLFIVICYAACFLSQLPRERSTLSFTILLSSVSSPRQQPAYLYPNFSPIYEQAAPLIFSRPFTHATVYPMIQCQPCLPTRAEASLATASAPHRSHFKHLMGIIRDNGILFQSSYLSFYILVMTL